MIDPPEGIEAVGLTVGTLLLMWLPVLWARYHASRASLDRRWVFGFVSGCGAHGASLLLGSLVSVPYEALVAPHIELEPYLQVQEVGASINFTSILVRSASTVMGAFFLIAASLYVPKLLTPAWRKLNAG